MNQERRCKENGNAEDQPKPPRKMMLSLTVFMASPDCGEPGL